MKALADHSTSHEHAMYTVKLRCATICTGLPLKAAYPPSQVSLTAGIVGHGL